jgi:hypothetical protein
MELTLKEELSYEIKEHHKTILFNTELIIWFEKYGDICDQLIMKMYNSRSFEKNNMTKIEIEAWEKIPKILEEDLLKSLVNPYNSKSFIIMPPPFEKIVRKKQLEIPIRKEIIKELRRIRDNGIGEIIDDYSKNCDIKKWEETTDSLKQLIEDNWSNLAKLTIKLSNSVYFVDRNSTKFWRDLTYSWSKDYFIC